MGFRQSRLVSIKLIFFIFPLLLQALASRKHHQHAFRRQNLDSASANDKVISKCSLSTRNLDFVISHFHEDPREVERYISPLLKLPSIHVTNPCVFVYTKSVNRLSEFEAAMPYIHSIVQQRNEGREGAAWLAYIIEYYDDLPMHVMFVHAIPNKYQELVYPKANLLFSNTTGFLHLAFFDGCTCRGCQWGSGLMIRLREIWAASGHGPCDDSVVYPSAHTAQFAVSSRRVHLHPKDFYKMLLNFLIAPPNHYVHDDHRYLDLRASAEFNHTYRELSNNNNLLGHTMERAWIVIFNCLNRKQFQCRCDNEKVISETCNPEICTCPDYGEVIKQSDGITPSGDGKGLNIRGV